MQDRTDNALRAGIAAFNATHVPASMFLGQGIHRDNLVLSEFLDKPFGTEEISNASKKKQLPEWTVKTLKSNGGCGTSVHVSKFI